MGIRQEEVCSLCRAGGILLPSLLFNTHTNTHTHTHTHAHTHTRRGFLRLPSIIYALERRCSVPCPTLLLPVEQAQPRLRTR